MKVRKPFAVREYMIIYISSDFEKSYEMQSVDAYFNRYCSGMTLP